MAISKSISEAPVITFLGAGASKPLGKMLMREFVASVRSSAPSPDLFNAICNQEEDLEAIFTQLAELETKQYLSFQNPKTNNFMSGANVKQAARELDLWLRREVFAHYRAIEDGHRGFEFLATVFKLLRSPGSPTVVFTTNYDRAIEDLCDRYLDADLIDGFKYLPGRQEHQWDPAEFDNALSARTRDLVVLFKLHGSTTWVKHGKRILKSQAIYQDTDPAYKNMLIFPASQKAALEEPYFTCYDYLGNCLAKAQLGLVIGYSFRDYDALIKIKAATTVNPGLKLLVLDPKAMDLCETLKAQGITALPMQYELGVKESEYITHLTSERMNILVKR